MRTLLKTALFATICFQSVTSWADTTMTYVDSDQSASVFLGQDPCQPCGKVQYDCQDGCRNGCRKKGGWEFDIAGWAEMGVYTNSHGFITNGPMHTKGNERTDFHLDQFYLFGDAKYKTRDGFEFGGRVDFAYGLDAPGMQCFGDDTFDSEWGLNRHEYALAVYQLYGTVSYEKLSVKVGKFMTPLGWEGVAAKDNFFYSHSYCYWLEPSTHCGFLADYAVNDRLTVSAGWTAGCENSFQNRFDDNGLLAGFTLNLTDKATIYYWLALGKVENGRYRGQWRLGDATLARNDYYVQTFCFEWAATDRFTYVMQYNLRNDADVQARTHRTTGRYSAYGINNHFLYKWNDEWATGMRLEWLRDNGGFGYVVEEKANYFQMTLGVNWTPNEYFALRPEIRYDSVMDGKARPYGNGRSDQVSGGVGMLVMF